MENADLLISGLKKSLLPALDLGGLHARNPTAHRWKAPYRSMQLREVVLWRAVDLLEQALVLQKSNHILGARVLIRSAIETIAMLIYLNLKTEAVLDGRLNFHEFSKKTEILLLGSRDGSTNWSAINIVTIFNDCEKRHPGIKKLYEDLSESAHPNYGGMSAGYTDIDDKSDTVEFMNLWSEMYSAAFDDLFTACASLLVHEYNDVWTELFEKLELWIEANDAELEATKPSSRGI